MLARSLFIACVTPNQPVNLHARIVGFALLIARLSAMGLSFVQTDMTSP